MRRPLPFPDLPHAPAPLGPRRRCPLSGRGAVGAGLLAFLVLFSFVGPLVDRGHVALPDLAAALQPPSAAHLLGTDALGRDVLLRLMVGGQLSLAIGFAGAFASSLFGTFYGLVAGLAGGFWDGLLMRAVDVVFALPGLFVLLFLDAVLTPSPAVLILAVAALSWVGVARLVRAEVLRLKASPFVEAARVNGASFGRILVRHLLPNVSGVVVVAGTFQVGEAILAVAALGFLGLGLPPPTPTWGGMLADGLHEIAADPWWLIYPPGLLILAALLGVNFLGEALRQAQDPRLSGADERRP